MTLKIDKYLANIIHKECGISHLDVNIWCGKTSKIREEIKAKITVDRGESFLADADYVIFFKGAILDESTGIKRLFDTVNRALGKDANSLVDSDFKKVYAETEAAEGAEVGKILEFVFVKITLN